MPTLEFKVSGQHIERVDDVQPVAKSRDYIDAHFEFLSPEWDGIKTAIFSSGNGAVRQPLDDNGNCVVPWEFWDTDDTTSGYVSVFCGDLVTADRAAVRMYRSGYADADESREPTKDEYQQLVERVETATSEAKAAAKSTAEDRAAVEIAKADIDKVAETFPQTVDKANKDIAAEGSKQVKSVAAAGENQIKAVAAEGSKQVETVTKAGQTQVQNVRDAVADLAITPHSRRKPNRSAGQCGVADAGADRLRAYGAV